MIHGGVSQFLFHIFRFFPKCPCRCENAGEEVCDAKTCRSDGGRREGRETRCKGTGVGYTLEFFVLFVLFPVVHLTSTEVFVYVYIFIYIYVERGHC